MEIDYRLKTRTASAQTYEAVDARIRIMVEDFMDNHDVFDWRLVNITITSNVREFIATAIFDNEPELARARSAHNWRSMFPLGGHVGPVSPHYRVPSGHVGIKSPEAVHVRSGFGKIGGATQAAIISPPMRPEPDPMIRKVHKPWYVKIAEWVGW